MPLPLTEEHYSQQRRQIHGLWIPGDARELWNWSKPTTIKNPAANAIVECIHGTFGEQLRATIFDANWSNDINTPIQACAFAFHVVLLAQNTYSPVQLAFGYYLIFHQKVIIDWEWIKAICTRQAIENNSKENKKRLEHEYKVGDKVPILFNSLTPMDVDLRPLFFRAS